MSKPFALASLVALVVACGTSSANNGEGLGDGDGGADAGQADDGGSDSSSTAVANARSFTGSNLDAPDDVAIDATGNVWVANSNVSGVTRIAPTAAQDCSLGCTSYTSTTNGGPGGLLGNLLSIVIDTSGNAWIAAGTILMEVTSAGVVQESPSTLGGDHGAIDNHGNIWLAGVTGVGEVSAAGTVLSPADGYPLSGPAQGLAVDAAGNVWVSMLGSGSAGFVVELPAGSPASEKTFSGDGLEFPSSLAVDNSGNVWVVNANSAGNATISEIKTSAATDCSSGCANYSGPMLDHAEGLAIDSANNVWVAGGIAATIIKIAPGAPTDCSTGCTTYSSALLSQPTRLAIDSAGNVWIADFDLSSVVEFPGVAAATKTPVVSQTR